MRLTVVVSCVLLGVGCAVVQPGEVGIKRRLGALSEKVHGPGPVVINPLVSRVVRVPVRTTNLEVALSLPSKEGLNISSEVSILYRVESDRARDVLMQIGEDYERTVVLSTFRSAAADVAARFLAKDMHTAERATIEEAVRERMMEVIGTRGFHVEAVLLKSIRLPDGLARAVEGKLEAEQQAERMRFVLERERLEAERKLIEAQGVRDAQMVVAESISEEMLQWNSIQAFEALAASTNAKVVVTDGSTPFLIE
ncbi:MAG: prohibitin family protein [Myxococcales bacterium]|nr:prohibitin family protein [Myxococcales bacterium]